MWLIVRLRLINGSWSAGEAALWTAGLTLATLAHWWAVSELCERAEREGARAWRAAFPLSGVVGLGALLIVLAGHSLTVGQFAGALSLGLLGVSGASLVGGRLSMARCGAAVAGLLAPVLWMHAALWTELGWWYAGAPWAMVFVGLGVDSLRAVRARRGWVRGVIVTLAATAPLLALAAWEMVKFVRDAGEG